MWRLTAPGGVLAVTTWGPGQWEPANSLFWHRAGEAEPALYKALNPWDEITTPALLAGLFSRAGVPDPAVEAAAGQHRLDHPDRFWDVVLGSGCRAPVDALRRTAAMTSMTRCCRGLGRGPRSGRAKWLYTPLIRPFRYASVGGADLRKDAS
jgi:hypothetical protein